MRIFSLENKSDAPSVIALGFFDGVHLGHRAVLKKATEQAKSRGVLSAVFSFTDNKKEGKKSQLGEIYSTSRRCELFSEIGFDFVIMPDFSAFSSLSPTEFVDVLKNNFNAVAFVCGSDFRFGKGAVGDVMTLKELAVLRGIDTYVVDEVLLDGESVSSTRIRKALKDGDIKTANKLLGREYSIRAEVVHGKQIGTDMLYPTINQTFEDGGALLKFGVYASKTIYDGKEMPSVTNIGVCPTFLEKRVPTSETYIIDADVNLYGKSVEVRLLDFLREEKKFESPEALKIQIKKDIEAARKYR